MILNIIRALNVSTNLLDVSVVGSTDELFKVGQTVCFGVSEHQFGLNVRFSCLLSGHQQVTNQIFPVFWKYEGKCIDIDLYMTKAYHFYSTFCKGTVARVLLKCAGQNLKKKSFFIYYFVVYSLTIHHNANKNAYGLNDWIEACQFPTQTWFVWSLHHFHVWAGIVSFDVGVDCLLHHTSVQLCTGELWPYTGFVATFGKLVSTVQVVDMLDQNLGGRWKDLWWMEVLWY